MQGEFQKNRYKGSQGCLYQKNLNKFKVVATQYHPLNVLFKTGWRKNQAQKLHDFNDYMYKLVFQCNWAYRALAGVHVLLKTRRQRT